MSKYVMQTIGRWLTVSAQLLKLARIKGGFCKKKVCTQGLDEVVKEAITQPWTKRRPVESRFLGQSTFRSSGERSRSRQDQERPFVSITFRQC